MSLELSERLKQMAPSATMAMAAKAKELKAQGRSIISFTAGEPNFNTPDAAKKFAVKAMNENQTHYTVTAGAIELRQAIAGYYARHFDLKYDAAKEIITGTGAKQLLYEAMGCLVNPGDEVILFAPAWVSYYEQIKLFGGVPVVIDTESDNYIPSPDKLEQAVNNKTKIIILNNPNNPTGAVYPHDVLEKIARIAVKHNLIIINDEIYERLIYGVNYLPHVLKLVPEARDLVLNINGVSKSYAMTGWRLGYALGCEKIIKGLNSLQGHLTSNTSSITQWAAVGALTVPEVENEVESMRVEFGKRRDLAVKLLNEIPGLKFTEPSGAFYIFIDISNFLNKKLANGKIYKDDAAFCNDILEEKGLGLVPGSAFLSANHVRISYSCSEDDIIEGMKRLKEFLA